jgi:hypothetical protein
VEQSDLHKFVQTEYGTVGGNRRKRMLCKYHKSSKLTSYYCETCLKKDTTMIFVCPECIRMNNFSKLLGFNFIGMSYSINDTISPVIF